MPDEPGHDLPSEPAPPPLDADKAEERLEQLGEKIESVKRNVHEDLDPNEDKPTYESSGDTPEADDQTITPPG